MNAGRVHRERWTTLQQASLYTRSANRRRMSDSGMALVGDAWASIFNLPGQKADEAD